MPSMHMAGTSRAQREILLPTSTGAQTAFLVGPSLRGHVYRSANGDRYFRLLPCQDVSLAQRHAISQRKEQPRQPLIAPIVEIGNVQIGNDPFVFVSYDVWANGSKSLSEVLRDADPRTRIALVAKVLQALPDWWQRLGEGLLPLPADIVFNEQWPFLLALPSFGCWPRIDSLLAEPSRIAHLAPELVRGAAMVVQQRAIDVFACGALGLQSLFSFAEEQPAAVTLQRAASATTFARQRLVSRMPVWMDRDDHFRLTCDAMFAVVQADPRARGAIQPAQLASALAELASRMDPLQLASGLRQQRRLEDALAVLEAASHSESDPALPMLGARISGFDLGRPMAAIEWYERVLVREGAPMEASYEQVQMLLQPEVLQLAANEATEVGDRLEIMLWRNYNGMSPEARKATVAGVATFFTARSKPQFAQQLLHPYLWQDDTFVWWDIPSSLSYGEALAADGRLPEAASFLAGVEHSLFRMQNFAPGDTRFVDPDTIEQCRERLAYLFNRYQLGDGVT